MASASKEGTIVRFGETAVHDFFVQEDVLDLWLRQDNGEIIQARCIPRKGFYVDLKLQELLFHGEPTGDQLLGIDSQAQHTRGRKFANEPFRAVSPNKTYSLYEYLIRASVGDKVRIEWDYDMFDGYIVEFAESRTPMSREYPVKDTRAFAADDVLDSLNPEG